MTALDIFSILCRNCLQQLQLCSIRIIVSQITTKSLSCEQKVIFYFTSVQNMTRFLFKVPKKCNLETFMGKDGISSQPKMSTNEQIMLRTQVLCKGLKY